MAAAILGPTPWMYWSEKRIFFFSGMSIPAIRGMVCVLRRCVYCGLGGWFRSALSLLQPWVLLVDDESLALSNDDLAIECLSLDAAPDFHGMLQSPWFLLLASLGSLLRPESRQARYVMRPSSCRRGSFRSSRGRRGGS